MMKKSGNANTYAARRKVNGADSYGSWNAGVQVRSEFVAGRVLTYDARTGAWR